MKTFILALVAWFLGLRYEHSQRDLALLWNRILCYFYLRYLSWNPKLPKHDYFTEKNNPYNNGILYPDIEWELERPIPGRLGRKRDELFFCGTRTSGECFVARVYRRDRRHVDLWIYLRMKNGDQYEVKESSLLDLSEKDTFAAKGLRVECQSPMRQWRIVFNGLMRGPSDGSSNTSKVHVRINFLWKASSAVFDIQTSASYDNILDSCVVQSLRRSISNCGRIFQLIDGYEQRGELMGTVTLPDEQESEVYLWGTRQRLKGGNSTENPPRASHIFGQTKGAQAIHLAYVNTSTDDEGSQGTSDTLRLIYGSLQPADGVFDAVTDTSPVDGGIPLLQDNACVYITAGNTHKIQMENAVTLRKPEECDDRFAELRYFSLTYDGVPGSGIGLHEFTQPWEIDAHKTNVNNGLVMQDVPLPSSVPLVANISDDVCTHTSVAGGKGSSLCVLNKISRRNKDIFKVPGGVIVTTAAYDLFLRQGLASVLETILQEAHGEKSIEAITRVSESAVRTVTNGAMPKVLKEHIRDNLTLALDGDIEAKRFAVRSSCTGEDTSEMSAAGQLETFLGVRGMEAVYEAVVKCWASQFSPVALQYKRRYGQLLNSPMAVVIMEMVASDAAGVMFTSDPRTGDPSVTCITANYGLGESVVSGLVESDVISVVKGSNGKMTLGKVTLGAKGNKIIMDDSGGTRTEVFDDNANSCSISEGQALQLTAVGSIIEAYFGESKDVEWATGGEDIYVLQARPITSLYEETEFESMHVLDTAHQSEWEIYTTANVGEVVNRGMSPLGSTAFLNLFVSEWMLYMKRSRKGRLLMSPYFNKTFPVSHLHNFLDMCEFCHLFGADGEAAIDHIMLSIFGRKLKDKDLEDAVKSRNYSPLTQRWFVDFKTRYLSGLVLKYAWKKYGNFSVPTSSKMSAHQLYDRISRSFCDIRLVLSCHMDSSMASSLFNHDVICALCDVTDKSDMDEDVYAALGSLISSCHNPISADVPRALECLAEAVAADMDPETFAAMSTQQATDWLSHSSTGASKAFLSFLETHGHRGYNEFDVYQPPWRMDPTILVKNLQVLALHAADKNQKVHVPVFAAISSLNIPLTVFQRLRLAYKVEMSRRSVAERECSKSLIVKAMDAFRLGYNELAEKMLQDGFLPEKELLFFMTHQEVGRLLDTRSATILSRAYKRRAIFPKVRDVEFPEITKGPIHPIAEEERDVPDNATFLKGFPISKGSVEGQARVIMSLEEASTIQRGDILITHATDIGWTPYFTLISGIVTELGGLLSHGAVVAREYGLPCIVGLHGATKVFKTGDRVYLNASQGLLQKVENDAKNT